MPTYEYRCEECPADFEELHILRADVEKYRESHPCPVCGKDSPRKGLSVVSFKFAGGVRGTSGVHGNSGSHDLDYPTLDKAVGRSAEARWKFNMDRQKQIASARSGDPTVPVTLGSDGVAKKADPSTVKLRETAIKVFDKAKNGD